MVYLYAAMGVVMMTGIMAVFEMGLSLTGQSILLKPMILSRIYKAKQLKLIND